MGRAKDWEMEQEERGWWSVPGKYVCAECFEEDFLREFVRDHAEVSKCDYCGSTAEELTGDENALIAAPLDSVLEIIAEGLHSEWNDANAENIPYESAEGGYQADTKDTYDLVWDYVCPANREIAGAIINALPDQSGLNGIIGRSTKVSNLSTAGKTSVISSSTRIDICFICVADDPRR